MNGDTVTVNGREYTVEPFDAGHGVILTVYTPVRTAAEQAEFEARLNAVRNQLMDMVLQDLAQKGSD
jgi:hypothetical protein